MKLLLYIYRCASCKHEFKAPELPGEPYGEFLMRSSNNNEVVYLPAIQSQEFEEMSEMLKNHSKLRNITDMERATILHRIFGIACDLASDGSEFKIGANPICPMCKSNNMAAWRPTHPPELIEIDIKPVTHNRWQKLSSEKKAAIVNKAIELFIKK